MKYRLIVTGCVALVLILGSAAGSLFAAGPATQVPATVYAFDATEVPAPGCSSEVLGMSTVGNTLHLKLLNRGLTASDDPRLTGQATVEVDVSINNVSGHINAHGFLVIEPDGYAGTWEGAFTISAPGGKLIDLDGIVIGRDAHINVRGTGELEGQWFLFEHGLAVSDPPYEIPVEDPDGPGGCEFLGEVWTGRILDPNRGP